jgi:hypothetical protein
MSYWWPTFEGVQDRTSLRSARRSHSLDDDSKGTAVLSYRWLTSIGVRIWSSYDLDGHHWKVLWMDPKAAEQ